MNLSPIRKIPVFPAAAQPAKAPAPSLPPDVWYFGPSVLDRPLTPVQPVTFARRHEFAWIAGGVTALVCFVVAACVYLRKRTIRPRLE